MTADVSPDIEQRATLLDAWAETRREIARLEAAASELLAERSRLFHADVRTQQDGGEMMRRSMVAEYAAAGHLSKFAVESALADAAALDKDFPAVLDSLREGRITPSHVREITRAGAIVREAVMNGTVEADALAVFAEAAVVIAEGDTPGRTRPQVRAVAATLAQVTLLERHAKAAEERSVSIQPLDDGLARLVAVLPEYLAVAIYDRLTRMTRRIAQQVRDAEAADAAGAAADVAEGAADAADDGSADDADAADDDAADAAADAADADLAAPDGAWAEDEWTGVEDEYDDNDRADDSWFATQTFAKTDDEDLAPWDDGYGADIPDEWTNRDAVDELAAQFALAALVHDGILDPDVACPDLIPEWMITDFSDDSGPSPTGPPPPTPPRPSARAGGRTYDQIRADLLCDLLLAAEPSDVQGTGLDNITAHIQVTVAASMLAGANDLLAELDGHGPVHPDVARDLASRNTGWTRLFLDPAGQVTETDTYTPTEGMRRFLRARDEHCRFPGCRVPAARCDIDHNRDHARGGPTALNNLTHLCRAHHALKHPDLHDGDRWTARLLDDGTLSWTSPLGRNYADPPSRRVMFV